MTRKAKTEKIKHPCGICGNGARYRGPKGLLRCQPHKRTGITSDIRLTLF